MKKKITEKKMYNVKLNNKKKRKEYNLKIC